ncbi:MAG: hypothetical protein KDA57_21235 [Planctomycetales bacterium]|nr:hypothetical protein [Planctomycetales bacterium]
MQRRPSKLLRACSFGGAFGALCTATILAIVAFRDPLGPVSVEFLFQFALMVWLWVALGALAGCFYVLPAAIILNRIGMAGPIAMLIVFLLPALVISGVLRPDVSIPIFGWGLFGWPAFAAMAYRPVVGLPVEPRAAL